MSVSQIHTASARLTCLCGAVSEPGSLIKSEAFPIPSGFCNCTICRRTTGAICASGVRLGTQPSPKAIEACQRYSASDFCDRYFCRNCGSNTFFSHPQYNSWYAFAGTIDRTDEHKSTVDTLKIGWTAHYDSSANGGLLRRVAEIGSPALRGMDCYAGGFEKKPAKLSDLLELRTFSGDDNATKTSESSVHASCHCGGVQFQILPASSHNADTSEALLKRWTRADSEGHNRKYVAKICVCQSCRIGQGTPIATWTYVFPECLLTSAGDPIPFSFDADYSIIPCLSTLKTHKSSEKARRSFCSICGANIFYERTNRPQIINVAPGLIHADSGVLAEEVLSWDWGWVSWPDENENRELLGALTGGKTGII